MLCPFLDMVMTLAFISLPGSQLKSALSPLHHHLIANGSLVLSLDGTYAF